MSATKKNIAKDLLLNVVIIMVAVVLVKSVSYANEETDKDNKNVLIQTGNMQVVLNTPNERYEFEDLYKLNISDIEGLKQKPYSFSVKNTGNIPIEYYEIRLVDEENKISTLPHKYLRYSIKKNDEEYSKPNNLGDVDSILYGGFDLKVGEIVNFDFKLWLDDSIMDVQNKELYSAIEITLYQKYDVFDNYLLYDGNGGTNVPVRSSIYNPVSLVIPFKDGFKFLGWSKEKDGEVMYQGGDTFNDKKGTVLYAVWG